LKSLKATIRAFVMYEGIALLKQYNILFLEMYNLDSFQLD
jgi:hypothetical protein